MNKTIEIINFSGGLKRLPFLGYVIFVFLLNILGFVIFIVSGFMGMHPYAQLVIGFFLITYLIAVSVALSVRRLHDIGLSGRYVLIPFVTVIVCALIVVVRYYFGGFGTSLIQAFEHSAFIMSFPGFASTLLFVFLLFFPGKKGFNIYTDDDDDDIEMISERQLRAMQSKANAEKSQSQSKSKAQKTPHAEDTTFKAFLVQPISKDQFVTIKAIKEDNDFITGIFVPKTLDRIDLTLKANASIANKLDVKNFLSKFDFKIKYVD